MARITVVIVCSLLLLIGFFQSAVSAKQARKTIFTQKLKEHIDTQDTDSVQGAALKSRLENESPLVESPWAGEQED